VCVCVYACEWSHELQAKALSGRVHVCIHSNMHTYVQTSLLHTYIPTYMKTWRYVCVYILTGGLLITCVGLTLITSSYPRLLFSVTIIQQEQYMTFAKRALQKRLYSEKETYKFKVPTNRSLLILSSQQEQYITTSHQYKILLITTNNWYECCRFNFHVDMIISGGYD